MSFLENTLIIKSNMICLLLFLIVVPLKLIGPAKLNTSLTITFHKIFKNLSTIFFLNISPKPIQFPPD